MPIYEFKCPKCNRVHSKLSRIGESGEFMICSGCDFIGLVRKLSEFSSPGTTNGRGCPTGCSGNCSGCH